MNSEHVIKRNAAAAPRPEGARPRGGFSKGLAIFIAAHVPLAILMSQFSIVATVHGVLTFAVGLWYVAVGRRPERVAYVAAYIAGAEVLWRMSQASLNWEFGKYAVAALLGLALLRHFKRRWRGAALPLLYLLVLLPSAWLTLDALGASEEARQQISFNISGSVALAVCALFFLQVRFTWEEMHLLLWYFVAPIAGIAGFTLYGTMTAQSLHFTTESNFMTSGGFGPNQVSAVLGLGALLCLIITLQEVRRRAFWVALPLMLWFLAQSVMTFSRGGVFGAAACMVLVGVHHLRQPRMRAAFVAITLFVLVGGYLIFPQLNDLTDGMLEERYTNMDSTHRAEIAETDLEIWQDNILLGVGPGMARELRFTAGTLDAAVAAHTEFTRMLAEHGVGGLVAILLLLAMIARAYGRADSLMAKALVAALAGWSLAEMSHSAMRIVAISFLCGLVMAQWQAGTTAAKALAVERRRPRALPPLPYAYLPAGETAAPSAGRLLRAACCGPSTREPFTVED